MKNKKEIFAGILILGILIIFFSCKKETYSFQENELKGKPYNPALPVEITGFLPDEGRIREKIVISGSNFGNDPSQVKVLFDDGISEKEGTVISVDGTSLYCLAPRQSDGDNQLKVSVFDSTPTVASQSFRYNASANVSWVAGYGKRGSTGAKYEDGTLAEAHFWKIHGIVALEDEQLMTFGYYEDLSNNVRFISVPDDKVITLQNGVYLGKPAINENKTRVYATTLNPPHTVYEYKKEGGWTPYAIGEIVIPKYDICCDRIRSLVMMDKEHDPNQEWLYFCHKNQTLGRFNINTEKTEIIADETLDLPVKEWGGYLTYDNIQDCFYVSLHESYSIYKITRTGTDWGDGAKAELYAGSPNESAVKDGNLADARFSGPMGMCLDEDGNLYVCENCVIRKISASDGYVSTIAGQVGVEGAVNGDPAEATFLWPYDICYDGEGNFYIAEFWESTIRKYTIE